MVMEWDNLFIHWIHFVNFQAPPPRQGYTGAYNQYNRAYPPVSSF